MKITNTYKLIIILLLILNKSWSQNEATSLLPNIVPPAPSAYQLGNYGNVPIGLVNGTSNINIPLLTFSTKNLTMPLNLFYGSNGLKVDDLSSSVGLGWNMNAGGIITRSANDVADEKNSMSSNDIPDDALLDDGNNTAEDINYFYVIGNNERADSETDIFSFNFNSISGKFVLDKNQNPVVIENQNVKVEKVTDSGKISFVVTTNDGVKYYFTETETTVFRSQNAGFSLPQTYTTSWYLSKIKHPFGDEIYLEYESNDYNFIASESQSLIVSNPYNQENCTENGNNYQYGPVLTNITSHGMSINGKHIKKIYSNNTINGVVNFLYYADNDPEVSGGGNRKIKEIQLVGNASEIIEKVNFNYTVSSNKRTFLNEIFFKDISKKYKFDYISPDQFPLRLSKSQDHWGYYNGISNTSLVPKVPNFPEIEFNNANKEPSESYTKMGMLKKICYPTKGCSEFEYEANTFRGQKTITPAPVGGNLMVYIGPSLTEPDPDPDHPPTTKVSEETIYLPFSQIVEVGGWGEFNLDACPASMNTDHSQANLTVTEIETNTLMDLYAKAQSGTLFYYTKSLLLKENISVSTLYFFGKSDRHYKISLKANVRCTAGGANFTYENALPHTIEDNIVTGGIRVKTVKDTDGNNQGNYKRFYYSSLSNLNISSGISSGNPYYISNSVKRIPCHGTGPTTINCLHVDVTNLVLSSSSIISLYDKGANVFYSNVTISYGDDSFLNGGENHQFIINRDLPGEVLSGTDFNNSSKSNSGWDNGLESKVIYFKKKNTANDFLYLKESTNTYVLDTRINKEVYNYPVRMNFQLDCYSFGQPDSIENLDIMRSVISSHWNYLSSNETKEYFYNTNDVLTNSILNETKYIYDNPNHAQLSRKQSINSTNETLQTKYFYPPDLVGEAGMAELTSTNRIADPVVIEQYNEINLISRNKTVFAKDDTTANLLLPKEVYSAKFPNSNATADDLKRKITYDKYDDTGNILQYTPEAGLPVSIIWGYNKTQPIAKIENKAYQNIPVETITNLQTLSNTDKDNCLSESCSEQLLRNSLNALRNSLSDSFVTTYTYNPLVGVTSITDPKGMASYYEYDAVGRLKFVKDNELNVLQKYCYNYKGQQTDCGDNTSTTVISYKSIARSGLFTKNNCPAGGSAGSIDYSQEIGAVISDISQTDADDRGLIKFNADGQAYANTNAKCTFWNVVQSQLITRNNCAAGGTPDSALYTVPATRYFSNISQADADAQAQAEINTNGQAFANANAKCTYWNFAKTQAVTRNNCPARGTPDNVLYTVPAGRYFSNLSQADADAQAQAEIDTNGQAYANANGNCTFWNIAKNQLFTRNNCGAGGIPESVYYNVAAGKYSSNLSQADADMQAQAEIDSNGQAYANTNATCTFWNFAKSQLIPRNNCAAGGTPDSALYTVPAGRYFSNITQADADMQAQTEINTNGQAFANANAKCTYWNFAKSQAVTRNNCPAGGTPDNVLYTVPAARYFSNLSQADADAQAQAEIDANGQAYANANGNCTFWNIAKNQLFTRNNCAVGGIPESVYYNVAAGKYSSNLSQADADMQAQAEIDSNGQAYANTNATCTFWNFAKSQLIPRNNCGAGGTPDSALYSVPAGKYFSNLSQADADAQAQTDINTNGQAFANATAKCTFYSNARSGSFTRNNCAAGFVGSSVSFSQAYGVSTSTNSQTEADSLALAKFNTDGQNNANSVGVCTAAAPVYTYDYTYSPTSLSMTLFAYCSTANHPAVTFKFIITYLTTADKLITVRKSIVLGANQLSASLTFNLGGVIDTQNVQLDGPVQ